jgi:hypothetical protein
MYQYIVLEDTLNAGVEKFEQMLLRPSDRAVLDKFTAEIDRLTRDFQEDWDNEFWKLYRFQRRIFTEITTAGMTPKHRRLQSAKLEICKKFDTHQPLWFESDLNTSSLELDYIAELELTPRARPPSNSVIGISEKADSYPANIFTSFAELNENLLPEPVSQYRNQDASYVSQTRRSSNAESRDSGRACCAKCSLM